MADVQVAGVTYAWVRPIGGERWHARDAGARVMRCGYPAIGDQLDARAKPGRPWCVDCARDIAHRER